MKKLFEDFGMIIVLIAAIAILVIACGNSLSKVPKTSHKPQDIVKVVVGTTLYDMENKVCEPMMLFLE